MKNNGTRYCETCGGRVVKNGRHPNGKQRWLCRFCDRSLIHRRDDKKKLFSLKLFYTWITNQAIIEMLFDKSVRTFQRLTAWCWNITPTVKIPDSIDVLVVDGTYIKKGACCIIAKAGGKYTVGHVWCINESIEAYIELFSKLPKPNVVVTDGFIGCVSAIEQVYGKGVYIQRCMFHVHKFISSKIGKSKRIEAIELMNIVNDIINVKTTFDLFLWLFNFGVWQKKYRSIFEAKPSIKNYTSYTKYEKDRDYHKKLRDSHTHLLGALHNLNLFTLTFCDNVPTTTNNVEGGINSRLKQLIRCHPGLTIKKQMRIVEWLLWKKSINPDLREFI